MDREGIYQVVGEISYFYLLMRQLSILDPSERNRYVSDGVYIVRRAPKRFLGQLSSLIHRCPMHWAHLMEGKAKM